MNRLMKQQMRIFNVQIPYEKKKETFASHFLTYKVEPPPKLSLDEKFLDVADMVRRLGLDELDTNKETEKIIKNPQKVSCEDTRRAVLYCLYQPCAVA